MRPALLGKKIGMTQVYDEAGEVQPVTVIQAGPCTVLQVKSQQTDGYDAIQLGFQQVKAHRATQAQIGHAAKAGTSAMKHIRELRLEEAVDELKVGQVLTVDTFSDTTHVDVIGTTKGKGYAGGMKRHNFKGQPASHGCERKHRSPGSIASHSTNRGTGPKPKKGKRMAGHLGSVRCTSRNHKLVAVDKENNLLLVKGSVPGANGGVVYVRVSKTAKAAK